MRHWEARGAHWEAWEGCVAEWLSGGAVHLARGESAEAQAIFVRGGEGEEQLPPPEPRHVQPSGRVERAVARQQSLDVAVATEGLVDDIGGRQRAAQRRWHL